MKPLKVRFGGWIKKYVRAHSDWEDQPQPEDMQSNANSSKYSNITSRGLGMVKVATMAGSSNNIADNTQPMNFRVYPAEGGRIVEYTYYDYKLERNHSRLHLITDEEDFGERISHILSLETLRS